MWRQVSPWCGLGSANAKKWPRSAVAALATLHAVEVRTRSRISSLTSALVFAASCAALLACGVAPIHRGDDIPLPPTWRYDGPHGRPIAYGGDVCAVTGAHSHRYPPSPRTAFEDTAAGWHDARPRWPYFNPHRHVGDTCFREGWHLHLEPPSGLAWDAERGAWRAYAQERDR